MMADKLAFGIARTARLVIDAREWFATTFRGGPELEIPKPGSATDVEFVRAIIRPTETLTVTAEPTAPRDPRWPFSGPVELVTTRTAAGLLAFFGRVRSPGGGPLRRLTLDGTSCNLKITAPGFQSAIVQWVPIPKGGEPTRVIRVDMFPGIDAAPTPTLLGGVTVTNDGQPIPNVDVNLAVTEWLRLPRANEISTRPDGLIDATASAKPVPAARSDSAGIWRFTLEGVRREKLRVQLNFQPPNGAVPAVVNLALEGGRANRFPQTVLRGTVLRTVDSSWVGVAGAIVTAAPFLGQTQSRADGSWVFYPALNEPLSGSQAVTVSVQPPGLSPVSRAATVTRGEANDISPFIIA
jgi:hypothetical protein